MELRAWWRSLPHDAPLHVACFGTCPWPERDCQQCDGEEPTREWSELEPCPTDGRNRRPRSEWPEWMLEQKRERDAERARRYRERKKERAMVQVSRSGFFEAPRDLKLVNLEVDTGAHLKRLDVRTNDDGSVSWLVREKHHQDEDAVWVLATHFAG